MPSSGRLSPSPRTTTPCPALASLAAEGRPRSPPTGGWPLPAVTPSSAFARRLASFFQGTITAVRPPASRATRTASARAAFHSSVPSHTTISGAGAFALHRGHLHGLARGQKACEQVGDGRRGPVARHEAALRYGAAHLLEHCPHLVPRGRALEDGLVRVAQKQEVRPAEVAGEHRQLALGIVLASSIMT